MNIYSKINENRTQMISPMSHHALHSFILVIALNNILIYNSCFEQLNINKLYRYCVINEFLYYIFNNSGLMIVTIIYSIIIFS